MQIDFAAEAGPDRFEADVCIIGAGAAGIALSCDLDKAGLTILMVESGGLDLNEAADALSEGETAGHPFAGLQEGRARALGGATRLWAGQCIRLDRIDFEARGWVPGSGWPIQESALAPFYDRAERFMMLPEPVYDSRIWEMFRLPVPAFDPDRLSPKFTISCREPDFKKAHGARLKRSRDVTVLLNATVVCLNAAADASRIENVFVRSLTGRSARITARIFVLCGGGIENPRLLLASNHVAPQGIGNAHDRVGRFLQDHPNGRTATIASADPRRIQEQFGLLYRGGLKFWPKLALSEKAQRRGQLLNGNAHPVSDYPETSGAHGVKHLLAILKNRRLDAQALRTVLHVLRETPTIAREGQRWLRTGRTPIFKPSELWVQVYTEQAPDPNNRVSLAGTRDAFGIPKPRIEWRLGELERRTFLAITEAIGTEFRRLGLGAVTIEPWLQDKVVALEGRVYDAYHHAGTTRMSQDARDGVVDTDCRVHGVGNLYVGGGSVFPTSGYANPTLTIVALAHRLGDHLRATIQKQSNMGAGARVLAG